MSKQITIHNSLEYTMDILKQKLSVSTARLRRYKTPNHEKYQNNEK